MKPSGTVVLLKVPHPRSRLCLCRADFQLAYLCQNGRVHTYTAPGLAGSHQSSEEQSQTPRRLVGKPFYHLGTTASFSEETFKHIGGSRCLVVRRWQL